MRDYKKLVLWQKVHRFVLPRQLRRAAISIATNLAEGCGKQGDREFARYASIAAGSASEAEYHPFLASDLGYLSPKQYQQLDAQIVEVNKMLRAFLDTLRSGS